MSATVGLPSNVVIRDLLLTLWFSRRRILLIMLAAMALAAYVAFQVEPKYQSRASFLVLLGSEYGMRPVGGQQLMSNINAVPEELLHTEADILSSDDLHRDVIEQIGLARLYPDLLKPPGLFARLVKQARSSVYDLLGLQDGRPPADGTEAIVQAERQFAQNFGVNVDRKSNIIQLFFQHPNAVLAADALKVLEARYFALREKLFADKQLAIVEADQNRAGAQLAAADAKLADFKRVHDVANFAERQKILMTGQGALEDQLSKAESATAGLQARLDGLTVQLKIASGQPNGKGNPNAAGALQGMVQAYQQRQNEALTTYRGSPAYDTARTEIAESPGGDREDALHPGIHRAAGIQQDRSRPAHEPGDT